jgi:hypothetical protein
MVVAGDTQAPPPRVGVAPNQDKLSAAIQMAAALLHKPYQ